MKKGFTLIELIGVIIVLAIIAAIAYPTYITVVKNNKEKAWTTSKNEIIEASKSWVMENMSPDLDRTYVKVSTLYNLGLLEKTSNNIIINPITNNSIMDSCVVVAKDNENNSYKYTFEEECNFVSLATELKKQYNSTNTVGLLKDSTGYYYKGTNAEVNKNFVWWAGILWRVISIDNSDNITMISSGPLTDIYVNDNPWKTKDSYDNSYINTWLNSTGVDGVLYKSLSQDNKNQIVDSIFNVGLYTDPSGIKTTQHIGMLDELQFTKAGGQSSYLDIGEYFWLGNTDGNISIRVVSGCCGLMSQFRNYPRPVRAVVKISSIDIISGDNTLGTMANPYKEKNKSTNTSDVNVGEYISVPYGSGTKYCNSTSSCTFRVVSKDNNSIKVTLNGILKDGSLYGSSSTYTNSNTIDSVIKNFANTILSTYRYTGTSKIFTIGEYGSSSSTGLNYNIVKPYTISQNYGLPVVGELFTCNDLDIGKVGFADSTVIENESSRGRFWTMNSAQYSRVNIVSSNSGLSTDFGPNSYSYQVRPVLFLNKGTSAGLTFTSGSGTPNDPYILLEK